MKTALNIHQISAVWWVLAAPICLSPVLYASPLPNVGELLAWGIALVAALILIIPVFLRWAPFRRWYCWTDAMSEGQKLALSQRNSVRYWQAAYEDGYVHRVAPYVYRIVGTLIAFVAIVREMPESDVRPILSVCFFYPMGVLCLLSISLPWPHRIFAQRKT